MLAMLMLLCCGTVQASEITVSVNGQAISFSQSPVVVDNRTLVPVRPVLEAMGLEVTYYLATALTPATVWVGEGDGVTHTRQMEMYLEDTTYKTTDANGVETTGTFEVAPTIINGNTMLPIRAVVEYFGGTVNWDGTSSHISITANIKSVGNTPGNLLNGGLLADKGGFVYYADATNGNQLTKADWTLGTKQVLSTDKATYINVMGNWIYYINTACDLTRIKTDGTQREVLTQFESYSSAHSLLVIGDTLYYTSPTDYYWADITTGESEAFANEENRNYYNYFTLDGQLYNTYNGSEVSGSGKLSKHSLFPLSNVTTAPIAYDGGFNNYTIHAISYPYVMLIVTTNSMCFLHNIETGMSLRVNTQDKGSTFTTQGYYVLEEQDEGHAITFIPTNTSYAYLITAYNEYNLIYQGKDATYLYSDTDVAVLPATYVEAMVDYAVAQNGLGAWDHTSSTSSSSSFAVTAGIQPTMCSVCSGSGYTQCSICSGSGVSLTGSGGVGGGIGYNICSYCSGLGKIRCAGCYGSGMRVG